MSNGTPPFERDVMQLVTPLASAAFEEVDDPVTAFVDLWITRGCRFGIQATCEKGLRAFARLERGRSRLNAVHLSLKACKINQRNIDIVERRAVERHQAFRAVREGLERIVADPAGFWSILSRSIDGQQEYFGEGPVGTWANDDAERWSEVAQAITGGNHGLPETTRDSAHRALCEMTPTIAALKDLEAEQMRRAGEIVRHLLQAGMERAGMERDRLIVAHALLEPLLLYVQAEAAAEGMDAEMDRLTTMLKDIRSASLGGLYTSSSR